jgi:hypothetical protein
LPSGVSRRGITDLGDASVQLCPKGLAAGAAGFLTTAFAVSAVSTFAAAESAATGRGGLDHGVHGETAELLCTADDGQKDAARGLHEVLRAV